MRRELYFVALLCCLSIVGLNAQPVLDLPDNSPESTVSQNVGISTISINYHSPGVKERDIWGALIPNDQIWRAGANENTIVTFSHDAKVEGKDIAAGSYGFHVIPSADKATLIFSNNTSAWGSFSYNQEEDALRVDVTPTEAPHQEWLKFEFGDHTQTSTVASLVWEKKRIPFKIDVDVHNIVIASIKDEMRGVQGFFYQAPNQAANYCLNNDIELEQGLAWADQAIQNTENFNTLSTKANILDKMGKKDESKELMDKAINHATASVGNLYGYGRQLIGKGDKEGAMAIFKMNAKRNKDHWLAPHGLARGHSALGNFDKALPLEKEALSKCPQGSKQFLEGYVKKLEAGEDFN